MSGGGLRSCDDVNSGNSFSNIHSVVLLARGSQAKKLPRQLIESPCQVAPEGLLHISAPETEQA